jgi:hypothetical protein
MDVRKAQSLSDRLKDKSLLKEQCYVGGEWVGATQTISVTDPASGDVIATVPKLSRAEVAKAPLPPPTWRCRRGPPSRPRNAPTSCASGSI